MKILKLNTLIKEINTFEEFLEYLNEIEKNPIKKFKELEEWYNQNKDKEFGISKFNYKTIQEDIFGKSIKIFWKPEYWYQRGFSEEETEEKINELKRINREILKQRLEELPKEEYNKIYATSSKEHFQYKYGDDWERHYKEHNKKRTRNSFKKRKKEYWLEQGYNEEDAIKKAEEIKKEYAIKAHKKRKENPEKYYASMNTKIEFYLAKGYSLEEAKIKLSERQTTFTLEKQINKLGPIQGYISWYNRQEKWQNTLNSKSEEEKREINKKKVVTKERYLQNHTLEEWEEVCRKKLISIDNFIRKYGEDEGRKRYEEWKKPKNILSYSKESIEFLKPIYNFLIKNKFSDKDIYWKEKEYFLYDKDKNKRKFYDFTIPKLKLIIEYHGSIWHYNPNYKYKENFKNPLNGISLNELKENDDYKRQLAINNGFKIIEVFDTDNKDEKQEEIINTINNIIANNNEVYYEK